MVHGKVIRAGSLVKLLLCLICLLFLPQKAPLCKPVVMEGGSALPPTSTEPCPATTNAGTHGALVHGPTTNATNATNAKPRPFWSSSTRERSERSWFSTETQFLGLGSSSASDVLRKLAANSWFTVKIVQAAESMRIPYPSLPHLSSGAMEDWQLVRINLQYQAAAKQQAQEENEKHDKNEKANDPPPRKKAKTEPEKPPVGRTRKIRLYPTREEREMLARWFGAARWTYNQALEEVREKGCAFTEKALRARVVHADGLEAGGEARAWLKQVPCALRDEGLRDLLKAYKSNFAKRAKNPEHVFELKFRSKKRLDSETIVVHSAHWKHTRGMYAWLHAIHSSEPLPDSLMYDARLQRTKAGEYFLCVPMPLVMRDENQVPSNEEPTVVALDPGVRTFQTCYDPVNKQCIKWGDNDIKRIYRLCHSLDDLESRYSRKGTISSQRRSRMSRAACRIRTRIRNLVDDVQRKMIKWLCESYWVILLPKFETQRMISKRDGRRKIRRKTARAMATWAHYRFRTRLVSYARAYSRCSIKLVDEAYTSKTCGKCGELNHGLGGSKVFVCKQCHYRVDRDLNGARNIYLRNYEALGT